MKIDILTLPKFDREFKRLSKKYKSLQSDLLALSEVLMANPKLGVSLGADYIKYA